MSPRDEALLHPVRMRIMQVLASGGHCTARQIDEALTDVPQTSLYRHLGKLVEAGLIQVISERPVRGSVEKTYGLITASPAQGPDVTAEDHLRAFLSTMAVQLSSLSRYLDGGARDLDADRVAFSAVPAWLSDDEVDKLRAVVDEMLSRPPSPERRLRLIALATLPPHDEP